MENIKLNAFFHNEKECIGIYARQDATLNYYFQKKAGAKWSRTRKCWYIPCTEKNYELLAKALAGKAILEANELKKYLLERKKTVTPKQHVPLPVIQAAPEKIVTKSAKKKIESAKKIAKRSKNLRNN